MKKNNLNLDQLFSDQDNNFVILNEESSNSVLGGWSSKKDTGMSSNKKDTSGSSNKKDTHDVLQYREEFTFFDLNTEQRLFGSDFTLFQTDWKW